MDFAVLWFRKNLDSSLLEFSNYCATHHPPHLFSRLQTLARCILFVVASFWRYSSPAFSLSLFQTTTGDCSQDMQRRLKDLNFGTKVRYRGTFQQFSANKSILNALGNIKKNVN